MPQGSHCIVLTGGIGSGKSHVAARLAERGWEIISADQIGHAVLQPGGAAFTAVADRWPEVLVDGRIDRRALGRIVFDNPAALAELEAFTHPAIRAVIAERLAAHPSRAVLEIPLLTDWLPGWPRVVVDAPDSLRRERLILRGMEEREIDARMAAQPSRDEWRKAADFVVDNGLAGDLGEELDRLEAWVASRVAGLTGI